MNRQQLRISLVIPVYNDADCLLRCLQAVAGLEQAPFEVIVVDNNSTDNSREVALSFAFARVVEAKRQGVVHARNAGFDAATGDIIARIDSDTLLPENWLGIIEERFAADRELGAISGSMIYYDFYWPQLAHWLDKTARKFMARFMPGWIFLNGSNMALRKTAWERVKADVCSVKGIHEDLDLAVHLQMSGMKVGYYEPLEADISIRRMGSGFIDLARYSLISPKTYARHQLTCRWAMYPIIFIVWLLYPFIHVVYLSFDERSGTLSLSNFFSNRLHEQRVEPWSNVV